MTHGNVLYTVTKHAVVGLSEWLAVAYHERGIRVSCLCPLGGAHADARRSEQRVGQSGGGTD